MYSANGRIIALVRGGRTVYDAIYERSYRHNAERVANWDETLPSPVMWATQDAARLALIRRARFDACSIVIAGVVY